MESYKNKMAKALKGFENPGQIGSIVGKVIEPFPDLKISILDGQVILYPEQLYINELLTNEYERQFETIESKVTLNANTENATAGVTGQATETPGGHSHSIALSDKDYTSKGKIKLVDTLKKGDLVKLTPTADEQTWFVDYRVRKVSE